MDETPIRIQGDPEVIEEIAALVRSSSHARFVRVEQDDQGGIGADFVLETVATLIAIASGLFFEKPILPNLYKLLNRHKGTTITIETPTQTVSIESTKDLSLESLKAVLDALEL